ncbi:uncharacterized protein LOC108912893 [Anoplophora glabripennis]|uniref:uncharacterized protein LOC108912893 n=1 Tax=Anoplophora glabripennis TaxID=217634 RepID=UPI000874E1C0|nr:uncharacterized protein LOC108912893 [Anoplophora glabripennis]
MLNSEIFIKWILHVHAILSTLYKKLFTMQSFVVYLLVLMMLLVVVAILIMIYLLHQVKKLKNKMVDSTSGPRYPSSELPPYEYCLLEKETHSKFHKDSITNRSAVSSWIYKDFNIKA